MHSPFAATAVRGPAVMDPDHQPLSAHLTHRANWRQIGRRRRRRHRRRRRRPSLQLAVPCPPRPRGMPEPAGQRGAAAAPRCPPRLIEQRLAGIMFLRRALVCWQRCHPCRGAARAVFARHAARWPCPAVLSWRCRRAVPSCRHTHTHGRVRHGDTRERAEIGSVSHLPCRHRFIFGKRSKSPALLPRGPPRGLHRVVWFSLVYFPFILFFSVLYNYRY